MNKPLSILVLSTHSPYKSANLGFDMIQSLERSGHTVDFITKYKFDNMLQNMFSVYDCYEPEPKKTIISKLRNIFPVLKYIHKPSYYLKRNKDKQLIVYADECYPYIDVNLLFKKIHKKYDMIITLFWANMITTKMLTDVYNRLHCPIFIFTIDMFFMTGGCYYFMDCRRFFESCGMCPGLNSSNSEDQTHKNFMIKKTFYQSIEYILCAGNTWIYNWALRSPLLHQSAVKKVAAPINEETFQALDKNNSRKELHLNPSKTFIMFAGSAHLGVKRKGFDILVQSVNNFVSKLSQSEKDNVLLLLAGNSSIDNIQNYFQIDVHTLGYLDTNNLVKAYSSADCFLCTTLEDAGPTMVIQSLMCGTPVIAFEMGVALDIVITGVTGYLAKYKDVDDYTKGIQEIYSYTDIERTKICFNCREVALKEYALKSCATKIEDTYNEYINNREGQSGVSNEIKLQNI
jgi:glycosyltransferase involved in cell wall biosynthesis